MAIHQLLAADRKQACRSMAGSSSLRITCLFCFRQVGSHNRLLVFGFPPDRPRLLLLTHGACDLICQRFGEVADRCTTFRLEIGFDRHAWKELCPVDSLVDVSLVKGDFDRIKTFTGLSVETAISPHIEGVGSGGERTCKIFRWIG